MPEVQCGGRGGTQKGTGTKKTWQDLKSNRMREEPRDRSGISWEKGLKPFYLDLERQGLDVPVFQTSLKKFNFTSLIMTKERTAHGVQGY